MPIGTAIREGPVRVVPQQFKGGELYHNSNGWLAVCHNKKKFHGMKKRNG